MIERAINELLEFGKLMKIAHEACMIERCRLQIDLDLIVMTVQSSARMIAGEPANDVRGGEGEAFADRIHVPT